MTSCPATNCAAARACGDVSALRSLHDMHSSFHFHQQSARNSLCAPQVNLLPTCGARATDTRKRVQNLWRRPGRQGKLPGCRPCGSAAVAAAVSCFSKPPLEALSAGAPRSGTLAAAGAPRWALAAVATPPVANSCTSSERHLLALACGVATMRRWLAAVSSSLGCQQQTLQGRMHDCAERFRGAHLGRCAERILAHRRRHKPFVLSCSFWAAVSQVSAGPAPCSPGSGGCLLLTHHVRGALVLVETRSESFSHCASRARCCVCWIVC